LTPLSTALWNISNASAYIESIIELLLAGAEFISLTGKSWTGSTKCISLCFVIAKYVTTDKTKMEKLKDIFIELARFITLDGHVKDNQPMGYSLVETAFTANNLYIGDLILTQFMIKPLFFEVCINSSNITITITTLKSLIFGNIEINLTKAQLKLLVSSQRVEDKTVDNGILELITPSCRYLIRPLRSDKIITTYLPKSLRFIIKYLIESQNST